MVIALGQAFDERGGVDVASGLFDFRCTNSFFAEPDIGTDISGEEKDILLDDADAAAQLFGVPLANIETIDENFPFLNIVEAANEIDDRGLARTGGADECQALRE